MCLLWTESSNVWCKCIRASMVIVTIEWSLYWHTKMHIWSLRYTQSYASSFSCCSCWLLCTFTFLAGSAAAEATRLAISEWMCLCTATWMHKLAIDKRCNCLPHQQLSIHERDLSFASSILNTTSTIYTFAVRCEFLQFLATNLAHVCVNFISAKKSWMETDTKRERERGS